MKVLDEIVHILELIIKAIVAFLVLALVVIVFAQVILRYIFHTGLAWNDEGSRFLFIWVVFMSIPMATLHNGHMKLDMLSNRFPKIKPVLEVLGWVCLVVFFGIAGFYGVEYAVDNAEKIAGSVGISYFYVYLVLPLSCGLSIFFLIDRAIKRLVEGEDALHQEVVDYEGGED